jgi:hypothetical protein
MFHHTHQTIKDDESSHSPACGRTLWRVLGASASNPHTRILIHPLKRRSFSLVAHMNPWFDRRLWILALLIGRTFLTWRSRWFKVSRSLPPSLIPYLEEGRSRGCGSRWLVAVGIALEPERFGLEYTYILIYLVSIITLLCHCRLQRTYSLDFVYTHQVPCVLLLQNVLQKPWNKFLQSTRVST